MKIAIDISQIVYPRGVGRYTRELVKGLLTVNNQNEYILFGGSLRQQKTLRNFSNELKSKAYLAKTSSAYNLKPKLYPIPPTVLELLFNQIHFSIDPLIGKVDVFHSSDWTQPRSKAKKVTTIHDVIALKFPKLFDKKTIEVQKRKLRWVKSEVDKIIAVSQNTKKDVMEILQIPESKIEVIYEAASPIFYKRLPEEVEKVKKKFNLGKSYILTVNTRTSQKLAKFEKAIPKIKKNFDVDFVVVGQRIESDNVTNLGLVEDEDLARLYSDAAVFVFTSFYEGFGLPVLEAAACGAPVICSKTSSLPEIGGDAVFYVNPNSEQEIFNGVKKILVDKKFTQGLSKRALVQAKKFSWEKTALETLKVYEGLYDNRN